MLNWLVARRIMARPDDSGRVTRPAVRIATLGVALGVAVMLVSVSVARGFQQEVRSKIMGFGSHAQVLNYESLGSEEYAPVVIDSALRARVMSIPGVRRVQPFCLKPGMLKTDSAFRGVAFRGEGADYDASFLKAHLTEGRLPAFSDTARTGDLLVSDNLARQMRLRPGARVYAYFFSDGGARARRFTVCGVYRTCLSEFDNRLVFTDMAAVQRLLGLDPASYSGADVQLDDPALIDEAAARLARRVNRTQDARGAYYTSMSVKEMYPQMFEWLNLLDTDVWVILVLMACVAGFTMVSGLLIIILERTRFIGVMKALGASNGRLRRIFLTVAALIVGRGMLLGNALALSLILLQRLTGLARLDPQTYYVDAVPVLLCWDRFLLIDAATAAVSALALLAPTLLVSGVSPARAIRFE